MLCTAQGGRGGSDITPHVLLRHDAGVPLQRQILTLQHDGFTCTQLERLTIIVIVTGASLEVQNPRMRIQRDALFCVSLIRIDTG